MTRVAVYDDNKPRRESLQAFITMSPDLEHAGSFENCSTILQDVVTTKPDIILMDIEMPLVNGLEGVRKVKLQTAFDDDDKVFSALQAGAEGYILKSASITQIAQCIDEVIKGGAAMTPSIALKVMRHFGKTLTQSSEYNLSPKETEVLKHLAKGFSYKMIADEMGISYFTVNNHVKKVYEKLQVHSLGEAVALAHKNKLV